MTEEEIARGVRLGQRVLWRRTPARITEFRGRPLHQWHSVRIETATHIIDTILEADDVRPLPRVRVPAVSQRVA